MSDQQDLIAGCKRKDTRARKKLYELYAPAMLGICVRYVDEKETARDILHEGFIKVFTKIESYSGAGSFEGWMRKIFVTSALEYLRSIKAFGGTVSLDYWNETADNNDTDIVEQLSAEEIVRCINELPPGFRTVFNLYAIEGYSHAEIAQLLNIQEVSSRSQFARARKMLQTKIRDLYKIKR
ncbi:MAG: sigma-70 family RNA polymerase sigma factor [Dysgonamonadaceae bacterium]|jgi:RNA polymerase sigma-70 factor (ECF subfamily)|nr:sigma-70 family RNA polymerase sigma factor [Dysgonamonadaceae bacterium]